MSSQIIPRNKQFDFTGMTSTWLKGNFYLTQMFNTASIYLPYMEGLMSYIVRRALPMVTDEKLKIDCENFIKQESYHAREHARYNMQLSHLGFEAKRASSMLRSALCKIKTQWSLMSLLAVGVSFESITLMMSHTALEEGLISEAASPMVEFWCWHMNEEIEHRSVLFDLYCHLGGGYLRRIIIHSIVTLSCCSYSLRLYLKFVRRSGYPLLKGLATVLSPRTFFVKSLINNLVFYFPGFNPARSY